MMEKILKLEKRIAGIVFYIVPILVLGALLLAYKGTWAGGEVQSIFAGRGLNLLIFLLFIKPLYVISQKYFTAKKRTIKESAEYIIKGWVQKPILIFLKELVVNLIFSISGFFLKYRRLLGILTFRFIFLHLSLLLISFKQIGMGLFDNIGETFIWMGYVGMFALFVGFVTSNNLSVRILGQNWKSVQKIAYLALIAGAFHGSFREGGWWSALPLIIVFAVLKFFEWRNAGTKATESRANGDEKPMGGNEFNQWKCNPCGYIYDEKLGDPEGGITPGTKWEDIPNTWVCPICGVGKDQFTMIARLDKTVEHIKGKVINRKMLSDNVLELGVEIFDKLEISPGQRIGFVWKDEQGQFTRAYSVAYSEIENNVTDCVFLIKILDEGRGGKKLKNLKIGDEVLIEGVYGHFVLKDTSSEKFFIATGTGLAPIVNMIKHDKSSKRTLLFGAQMKKDILREDEIKKISNLDYIVFLSREEVTGYEYGRIDLSKFELNNNIEFYICGAPPVVKSMLEYLKSKGFDKVYYEEFF